MRTGHLKPYEVIVLDHEGEYEIVDENDPAIFTCCTCNQDCTCSYGWCEKCESDMCYNCTMNGIDHEESEPEPELALKILSESEPESELTLKILSESDTDSFDPFQIPFSTENQQLITFYFSKVQ